MKKIIYIVLTCLLASCTYIPFDQHYIPVGKQPLRSRALLLEFTGFKCLNCPKAAAEAHALLEEYADSLVVVEIHPSQNGFCETDRPEWDYSSAAGDAIYAQLGGTASTSLPAGVINLATQMMDYAAWQTAVESAVTQPTHRSVHIADLSLADRQLTINYTVTSLSETLSIAGTQVRLWLTEDSIVGPQRLPDGTTNMEYVHNHVLRDEILLKASEPTAQLQYAIPEQVHGQNVRLEHCHLVAILEDAATSKVLDAEEVAVIDIK